MPDDPQYAGVEPRGGWDQLSFSFLREGPFSAMR